MINEVERTDGPEDRRQHLAFIQATISRMSTTSTVAKGWCLTVATAALGFAVTKDSWRVGLLAGFVVALFGSLDARYLREERKFRALYDDARRGHAAVYDMDTRPYVEPTSTKFAYSCQWRWVVQSWSLWAFYGPLLLVAVIIVLRTAANR